MSGKVIISFLGSNVARIQKKNPKCWSHNYTPPKEVNIAFSLEKKEKHFNKKLYYTFNSIPLHCTHITQRRWTKNTSKAQLTMWLHHHHCLLL